MDKKIDDLVGQKFGKLTVLQRVFTHPKQKAWRCVCECGNVRDIVGTSLRSGNSQSCGCIRKRKYFMINQYKHRGA
jgi:hypothetical protein